MSDNSTKIDLKTAVKYFQDVQSHLETNKALPWGLGLDSVKGSLLFLNTVEAQTFINNYLLKVLTLMTQQNPSKLGTFEKNVIEESILCSLKICAKLLPDNPCLVNVISRLFDAKIPLYNGVKIGYTFSQGIPIIRINSAKRFSELKGFQLILETLKRNECPWFGADSILNILSIFQVHEIAAVVDDQIKNAFIKIVMEKLLSLPDELLKKENTESLANLIHVIGILSFALCKSNSPKRHEPFYHFWYQLVFKLITSSSLVLKLFGLEQLNDLIIEAKSTRPFPASFTVEGAGTHYVNGTYFAQQKGNEECLQYTKPSDGVHVPLLTLFRCTMRNTKSKWWFISQADIDKPGTEKDIDYYLHRSSGAHEEREPPAFDWVRSHSGMKIIGNNPPPVLKRGPPLLPKGVGKDSYLDHMLFEWANKTDLLQTIFTPSSLHREIVVRSCKLVHFYAEYDLLTTPQIQLLWKGAMLCNDMDIVEEIFNILVPMLSIFRPELLNSLLDSVVEALDTDDNYHKLVAFVERFSNDNFRLVGQVGKSIDCFSKISVMAWKMYIHPLAESTKAYHAVEELVSYCFSQEYGVDMVLERVIEYIEKLRKYSDPVDVTTNTSSLDEDAVLKVVHVLQFLVGKLSVAGEVLQRKVLSELNISEVIINEIFRFILSNRANVKAGRFDDRWYIHQISERFQLLQRYHQGLLQNIRHTNIADDGSIEGDYSASAIERLWQCVLPHPLELNQFFHFLKCDNSLIMNLIADADNNMSEEPIQLSIIRKNALQSFKQFICSDLVDWSSCGEEAFQCFKEYYVHLENWSKFFPSDEMLPPRLGLQTLWNIALSSRIPSSTQSAIELLLQSYEGLSSNYDEGMGELLNFAFKKLSTYSELEQTEINAENLKFNISRMVLILTTACRKFNNPKMIAHSAARNMSRFKLNVHYRRVSYYYNQATQTDSMRVDKDSDGVVIVEVHPYHTINWLRGRIIELAGLGDGIKITFDDLQHDVTNNGNARICELGLTDGQEIRISYEINFQSQASFNDYYDHLNLRYFSNDVSSPGSDVVQPSVGKLLSADDDKFGTLLSLCNTIRDGEVCSQIWELVQFIPTAESFLNKVVETWNNARDNSNNLPNFWLQLLNTESAATQVYLLQVIDMFLSPAPENERLVVQSEEFKRLFSQSGGVAAIQRILISFKCEDSIVSFSQLAVLLHILQSILFGADAGETNDGQLSSLTDEESSKVLEKLLYGANLAAIKADSTVVHDALVVITLLIRSPNIASELTRNPYCRVLTTTAISSASKKVRDMAAEFAIQIGKNQVQVFDWLLDEIEKVHQNVSESERYIELFLTVNNLLKDFCNQESSDNATSSRESRVRLATILDAKLLRNIVEPTTSIASEKYVLIGLFSLLENLVIYDHGALSSTSLDDEFIKTLLTNYLFKLPTSEDESLQSAICDSSLSRQAAFKLLTAFISLSQNHFEQVLEELTKLNKLAAKQMFGVWGMQISHEIKQADIKFTGLKNQGCTCYSNSLLQCLYMNVEFREAILNTPIHENFRTTLWHYDGIDLVGKYVSFELSNGSWRVGKIVGYDSDTKCHRVQYEKSDGTLDESAIFNIHEGRYQQETGKVKIVHLDEDDDDELEASEREIAAYQVLEQLQRTFLFLKYSKRKYFDPRPLVEACKTLNLNFNVYHQNDAAEFCDQLLDRIETATKGKHSNQDVWNEVLMKEVFGGKWLAEKIPQDCETYKGDKTQCGHWQSARTESFLKVELMIRGKENVDESLQELIQGELMDGDNKIQCDVCCEKKATVRRTCFGTLPRTLVLHLKRFDLDFQTFETVKLNNRMAFPTTISMLKYTKEGIDARSPDKEQQLDEKDTSLSYDESTASPLSPTSADDFVYELQGVLVHAGVAQGGHYYSFVKDSEGGENKWYRFDDEDVTPFDHEQIPYQCFGGSSSYYQNNNSNSHGNSSAHYDDDRTSNALILFYKKTSMRSTNEAAVETEEKNESAKTKKITKGLVDGNTAFLREVRESNLQYLLSCFLVDAELHSFVRGMISMVGGSNNNASSAVDSTVSLKWQPSDELIKRSVQFGCTFLLDVALHFRERPAMRSAVNVLKDSFIACPQSANWFVGHTLNQQACSWMHDYLVQSTDALARATFVQLLVNAVSVIAPKDGEGLQSSVGMKLVDIRKESQQPSNNERALCGLLIRMLIENIFKSVTHIRTADEIFMLIRDLALIPSVCKAMQAIGIISFLSYFIVPESVPTVIAAQFERHIIPSRQQNIRHEFNHLLQSIFEAIAALLGVPQTRKVNLLQEKLFWEAELIPEAKDAFQTIFHECCRGNSNAMDFADLSQYFDRIHASSGVKTHATQIRLIIDRYGSRSDNKLYLEGFLQHQTDTASHNPKQVWRDLHAFGYRNDLSRSSSNSNSASLSNSDTVQNAMDSTPLNVSENCKSCLSQIAFYEAGLAASEASAKAIAQRICKNESKVADSLIHQALNKLIAIVSENTWNPNPVSLINDFLKLLLSMDNNSQSEVLQKILMNPQAGFVTVICAERQRPSSCRANEHNKNCVMDRYVRFVQELTQIPGVLATLTKLAERDASVKLVKGMLRLNPGSNLTESEDIAVRSSVVFVEGAGQPAVNGEYVFKSIKSDAGVYERIGMHNDRPARFTLYKCSLQNGGYQWFISVTPDNMEPGTKHDIDFYYAVAKPQDHLPPTQWLKMNGNHTRDPSPRVRWERRDVVEKIEHNPATDVNVTGHYGSNLDSVDFPHDIIDNESSDSDKESLMRVGDDVGYDEFNTSGFSDN